MKRDEMLKVMSLLKSLYPNSFKDLSKDDANMMVDTWQLMFEESRPVDVLNAIKRLANTCKFIPSIAEIKQEIQKMNDPYLDMVAEDEWQQILIAVRKYGMWDEVRALESLNPFTKRIVKKVSFREICMSTSPEFVRKEFISLFKDEQNKTMMAGSMGDIALTNHEKDLIEHHNCGVMEIGTSNKES